MLLVLNSLFGFLAYLIFTQRGNAQAYLVLAKSIGCWRLVRVDRLGLVDRVYRFVGAVTYGAARFLAEERLVVF